MVISNEIDLKKISLYPPAKPSIHYTRREWVDELENNDNSASVAMVTIREHLGELEEKIYYDTTKDITHILINEDVMELPQDSSRELLTSSHCTLTNIIPCGKTFYIDLATFHMLLPHSWPLNTMTPVYGLTTSMDQITK